MLASSLQLVRIILESFPTQPNVSGPTSINLPPFFQCFLPPLNHTFSLSHLETLLIVNLQPPPKGRTQPCGSQPRAINVLETLPIISQFHPSLTQPLLSVKTSAGSSDETNMTSTANRSIAEGDTETSARAGPKTPPNLSIVYIDHGLDKPIAESIDDEVGENTSRPNLTLVYIDHNLDGLVPPDTNHGSPGSNHLAAQGVVVQNQRGLFRLPPELRIVIWELLLPGRRILRARARYGRDRTGNIDVRSSKIKGRQGSWHFRVYDWDFGDYEGSWLQLDIPNVLAICRESRGVALRNGSFIFNRPDKSCETGTWWNPDLDVLGFDDSWDLKQDPWALTQLQGLEHVKNIAIDERQAWTFCYQAGYNGSHPLGIPRELREPLAVTFEFRECDDRDHYILEFFPHFQQLSVFFTTIHRKKYRQWLLLNLENLGADFVVEDDAFSVTFRLGSGISTAENELRRYRRLCMETKLKEPDDYVLWDTLTDGPIYSVKNDDIDVDDLDHWMGAGFGMCQIDQEVPI